MNPKSSPRFTNRSHQAALRGIAEVFKDGLEEFQSRTASPKHKSSPNGRFMGFTTSNMFMIDLPLVKMGCRIHQNGFRSSYQCINMRSYTKQKWM